MSSLGSLDFALLDKYLHITDVKPANTLMIVPASDLLQRTQSMGYLSLGHRSIKHSPWNYQPHCWVCRSITCAERYITYLQ